MKKIILLSFAVTLLHICYTQKIQMVNGTAALKVKIGTDDGKSNDTNNIIVSFTLTGSTKDTVKISLIHNQADLPPSFVSMDNEVKFDSADFPDTIQNYKTVTKTIHIVTKPVKAFSEDYRFPIQLEAGAHAICGKDNSVIVHFNTSGQDPTLKYDSTNTIKTDFSFYTDFLGVDNERPNGLYQAELGFKLPTNPKKTRIIKNDNGESSFFQLFRSLYFTVNLMNLDNTLKEDVNGSSATPITKIDSTTQLGVDTVIKSNTSGGNDTDYNPIYARRKLINGFDLYQWASFAAKMKTNIFAFKFGNHNLYFGYNAGILRTPIYDSIANKRLHVTSFIQGPDLYYETHFHVGDPIFNVRVNLDYYWLYLWNNDLEQINAPVFKYNTQSPYVNYYIDSKVAKIFQGSFRIAYVYGKSDKDKSDGNQIFFRVSYSTQSPTINDITFHNGYTQIQFGGLFDISKIISKAPSQPGGSAGTSNSGTTHANP